MENQIGYYAVIPANIRYDNDLVPNAKLLYGEITALCNSNGYCWATNEYFANLYKVNEKSITRWISDLKSKNYISTNVETFRYDDGTIKKIRYIYLNNETNHIDKNVPNHIDTHIDNFVKNHMDKNVPYNNTYINTTLKENNISKDILKENLKNNVYEEQFNQFYSSYPKKQKKQDTEKWFKKNKPSQELFEKMMNSLEAFKNTEDWKKEKGKFIPQPTSWLNQKRWEDEIETNINLKRTTNIPEEQKYQLTAQMYLDYLKNGDVR